MRNKRVRGMQRKLSGMMPAARRRKARRQKVALFAAGSAAGAALAFLFDPQRGRARRKKAIDRVGRTVRRVARRTARLRRHMASDARGLARRMAARGERKIPETDAALVSKVESEVLGTTNIPTGGISINAENGIVVLRGQVEHAEQARRLEKAVRKIDGVLGVENLLHLPGTPAPSSHGRVSAGRI